MQLRVERIISPVRLFVLAFTALSWVLTAHPPSALPVLSRTVLIATAVYSIVNLLLIYLLPKIIAGRPWGATALDFIVIASWIYASGGAQSGYIGLALIGAGLAPLRNPPRVSLIVTAAYAVAVVVLAGATHWIDGAYVLALGGGLTFWSAVNYRDRRRTLRDDLTGSFTREFGDFRLADVYEQNAFPVALAVIDLDGFKDVNDTFGHPAGDAILIQAVRAISAAIRQGDLLARSGGDEFTLILPRTTAQAANAVAERVRTSIELTRFHHRRDLPAVRLTASIGVAVTSDAGMDRAALLQRADDLLYTAKETGRNRVAM